MSENGTIHITMIKNWVRLILFLRKGGGGVIVYLAELKKELFALHARTRGVVRDFTMLKPSQNGDFFQLVNNKGADQTVRMHRLVCTFVVRKKQSQRGFFWHRGPYDDEAQAY